MRQEQGFRFSSDGDLARDAEIPDVPDCLEDGIRHAVEVLNGRWPQWEKIALDRAAVEPSALSSCVTYAEKVIQCVWPELLRHNIACVDWSVAKGGFLCAYRWDGEQELDGGKFVWAV